MFISLCFCGAERKTSSLNKRVSQLEDACRVKEAERVDLELRLTLVQENLKKSQAGGALGAPVEAKPPVEVLLYVERRTNTCLHAHIIYSFTNPLLFLFVQSSKKKSQNIYSESLPVNCASEMRRRPPSVYASCTGTVMQKAKVTLI